MTVVRNIITRVGADASPLTEEMKKAQNTILSFKNESMAALKSFGIPRLNTTDLVESIQSGQRVVVNFTQESKESLTEFQQRVRTAFEEAGLDVTQYENVLKNATAVHAEFANGAVKNFQAVTDSSKKAATGIKGEFSEFKESISNAFKTMGDDSSGFGEKIGSVSELVTSGFGLMTGAVEVFLAIEVVKKVGEWVDELKNLATETQDVQSRFLASTGVMSEQATKFSEDLSRKLGVSLNQIKDEMGKEYLNTRMLGFDPTQAETMSEGITNLSYNLGKLRGEDPSEVFDKLKAGVEGQPKGLSELGIRITDVDIKNKALSEGLLKQGQTMSDQVKSLVIYQELMQKTAGIQDYYKTTTDDLSTQQTKLNTQFEEMKVKLATALTPAFEDFLKVANWVAEGLGKVVDVTATGIQYITLFAEDAYSAVNDILNLDFGKIGTDWQNNYNSIFNASNATKQYGDSLDKSIDASNAQDQATQNLNKSLNANVMNFDQVHNISNNAAGAMLAQADAVNNLADAMGNLNNNGMNNLDNKSKGIIIPIKFGDLPKFPTLPNPPAITVSAVDAVSPVITSIQDRVNDWKTNLSQAFNNAGSVISNWQIGASNTLDNFASKLHSNNTAITSWSTNAVNEVSSIISALSNLNTAFTGNALSISSWAKNTGSSISSWANNGVNNIQGFGKASTTNITNWANNGVTNVNSFVKNTGSNISGWASSAAGNIGNFATNASTNIANWANVSSKNVYNWASNAASNINGFITASETNINSWASVTSQDFNNWISATSSNIASWANSALNSIVSFAQQAASTISSLASSAGATISSGFHAVTGKISAGISNTVNYVEANPGKIIVPALVGAGIAAAIAAAPFTGGASLAAIPALAAGGVVTGPQLSLIGEAGPEAVIPLSQLNSVVGGLSGSNTNNSNANQAVNITLKLDGRTLARTLYQYNVNESDRIGTTIGYNSSYNYAK